MEYRFVRHWNYILKEEEHKILEAAISITKQQCGEDFLKKVASFIAEHTCVQYVLIGILSPDGKYVETKAFLKNGKEQPPITYPIQYSPCASVITQRFCYFPHDVQKYFPLDVELQELNIESYMGSIFLTKDGEPIGLIALMSEKEIENAAFAEHLVLVLSPAIEEELIRIRR